MTCPTYDNQNCIRHFLGEITSNCSSWQHEIWLRHIKHTFGCSSEVNDYLYESNGRFAGLLALKMGGKHGFGWLVTSAYRTFAPTDRLTTTYFRPQNHNFVIKYTFFNRKSQNQWEMAFDSSFCYVQASSLRHDSLEDLKTFFVHLNPCDIKIVLNVFYVPFRIVSSTYSWFSSPSYDFSCFEQHFRQGSH